MISPALFAAVFVALVGALIYWANPVRSVNRTVFACSINVSAWLACWHLGATSDRGLYWLRWTCSAGALIPLSLWLVKESIVAPPDMLTHRWGRRNAVWFIVPVLLAVLPSTDFFIPSYSTGAQRVFGAGYYVYIGGLILLYAALLQVTLRNLKALSGGRKLELQVWLGGGCMVATTVYVLIALSALTKDPIYRRLEPLAVLVFYVATAYAITTHRIFNARQIVLVGLEKLTLVTVVATVAYLLDRLIGLVMAEPFAMLVTTALALWFAALLNGWLDRIFRFYPQAEVARQAAFAIIRRETRTDNLEKAFVEVLKGWGQSETAIMLVGAKGALRGGGLELAEDAPVVRAVRQLRWATPERLARERTTPERAALSRFLAEQKLGVLVVGEGPTLTVLVGVGLSASRRPFTYPLVTQLVELASIVESALERAHFSVKAQHAEQLATVGLLGASLAHEIRNPLVTIKTFVQLLPKHYQDPVFREKFFGLIGDEVTRIDRLTEQLLDMASPRAYHAEPVELHPVLRASLELVAAKATDKHIDFQTDYAARPDIARTDPSAVKQVLLNLCFNAIQAVEKQSGARWIRVATRNVPGGIEMTIEDSGPGISPEIRPRLFQPFQSTKSSGFGLGLAICGDILAGLDATITVDPSSPGRGACFRVIFPCPA